MSSPYLAKGSDGVAQKIWEDVGRVAEKTPDWVKEQVLRASRETVNRIEERKSTSHPKQAQWQSLATATAD